MEETKQRTAETRGLRGAEAAAVLRFGLGEGAGAAGDGGAGDGTPAEGPVFERVSGQQSRPGGRAAAVGGVTLAVLLAAGVGFPHSGNDPAYGGVGAGSVDGPEGVAADSSAADRAGFTQQEPAQMSISRNSVRATIVAGAALIAASAGAQTAVQWKVSDGGNGHWYEIRLIAGEETWFTCRDNAIAMGGHLATISSNDENNFVFSLASQTPGAFSDNQIRVGPFLGGYQPEGSAEPAGGWSWVTDDPWVFSNWADGGAQPDNAVHCGEAPGDRPGEHYLQFIYASSMWNDMSATATCYGGSKPSYAVEWSADCNHDGIVDYGQILQGQLADADSNGVPDVCKLPTCADADLNPNGAVDGADLGALLAFWGPVSPAFPRADINGDGTVNGADLGILLSVWGPCGG